MLTIAGGIVLAVIILMMLPILLPIAGFLFVLLLVLSVIFGLGFAAFSVGGFDGVIVLIIFLAFAFWFAYEEERSSKSKVPLGDRGEEKEGGAGRDKGTNHDKHEKFEQPFVWKKGGDYRDWRNVKLVSDDKQPGDKSNE